MVYPGHEDVISDTGDSFHKQITILVITITLFNFVKELLLWKLQHISLSTCSVIRGKFMLTF